MLRFFCGKIESTSRFDAGQPLTVLAVFGLATVGCAVSEPTVCVRSMACQQCGSDVADWATESKTESTLAGIDSVEPADRSTEDWMNSIPDNLRSDYPIAGLASVDETDPCSFRLLCLNLNSGELIWDCPRSAKALTPALFEIQSSSETSSEL
jgi:hypothetical protein